MKEEFVEYTIPYIFQSFFRVPAGKSEQFDTRRVIETTEATYTYNPTTNDTDVCVCVSRVDLPQRWGNNKYSNYSLFLQWQQTEPCLPSHPAIIHRISSGQFRRRNDTLNFFGLPQSLVIITT